MSDTKDAQLIADAREQWEWIEEGDGDFDAWERLARMAVSLAHALEVATKPVEAVPNYARESLASLLGEMRLDGRSARAMADAAIEHLAEVAGP